MKIRAVLFWTHLATGVAAGTVIGVLSLTGTVLTLERQILAMAERDHRWVRQLPNTPHLPIETLLESARAANAGAISSLILRSDPEAAAEVTFGREETIYLNPYTGAFIGSGSRGLRSFFRQVEDWHRWLALKDRTAGRAITGACTLAFLGLLCSGFFLWWPKRFIGLYLKTRLWFRGNLAGRARDWNWHNVVGFWCLTPLLVIVLSGVIMAYPWANDLLYRMAGSPPPPAAGGGQRDANRDGRQAPPKLDGLSALWLQAEQQVSGWQTITLRIPASGRAPVLFVIDKGSGGRPDLRGQLTLDRRTGAVTRWEPFSSYNRGRQLRLWARFSHTGQAGGLLGQVVAALASAGAVLLAWTGLAMAWRRFSSWLRRNRNGSSGERVAGATSKGKGTAVMDLDNSSTGKGIGV